MSESAGRADKNCAFFGEGVTLKGFISAPDKVVIHGTVEGDVDARELLVGTTGTIKGNVRVDQANIQGKILENVEARVCLSLRKTGRVEGSVSYGEIEIEKGGILSGTMRTLTSDEVHMSSGTLVTSPPLSFSAIRSATDGKKEVEFDKVGASRRLAPAGKS